MYQMNSKIHPRKTRRTPQKGETMKTATMTAPGYLSASRNRGSALRYLPHMLIAALLFALLLAASQSDSIPVSNPSLTHLGQH